VSCCGTNSPLHGARGARGSRSAQEENASHPRGYARDEKRARGPKPLAAAQDKLCSRRSISAKARLGSRARIKTSPRAIACLLQRHPNPPKDIDLDNGTVRVLFAKGGGSRTVGIDPFAASELRRWVESGRHGDSTPVRRSLLADREAGDDRLPAAAAARPGPAAPGS
jgi:hypothetical protein